MSRQEVAEAVSAQVFVSTGKRIVVDGNYIGKLERGQFRWPQAAYRQALRAVFGASTDAELGFYISRRSNDADAVPVMAGVADG